MIRLKGLFHISVPILVWAGMVIAICMEAIVKFKAPSVTLEIGLDVGLQVFPALTISEWILFTICTVILYFNRTLLNNIQIFSGLLLVTLILLLQSFWLMPELISQASAIILGDVGTSSYAHFYYIHLTIMKLIGLFFVAHFSLLENGVSGRIAETQEAV